jgi:hypothetical protein
MVRDMKDTGGMTYNMVSAQNSGQTTLSTKVSISRVKSMEKAGTSGQMGQLMMETGLITG